MAKRPILVTGATGFTGGALARRLLRDGQQVRVLARESRRAAELVAAGAEVLLGDLRDSNSLAAAMADASVVYHVAASFRDAASAQELHEVNAIGTQSLLEAAINADVERFVHCSTIGVHGDVESPPADETAPFRPGDAYQASKLAAEQIVRDAMRDNRLPISIFRPGGMYGPRDTRFLKLFRAISRGRFLMIGDGSPLYHLTYIDDLVDGILLCGTSPEAVGGTFLLLGPEYTSLGELVARIAHACDVKPPWLRVPFWPVYGVAAACEAVCSPFGVQPPLFRRRVDFFRKSRAFDISKARRVLGFAPEHDLSAGLRRTVEWYRRERLL